MKRGESSVVYDREVDSLDKLLADDSSSRDPGGLREGLDDITPRATGLIIPASGGAGEEVEAAIHGGCLYVTKAHAKEDTAEIYPLDIDVAVFELTSDLLGGRLKVRDSILTLRFSGRPQGELWKGSMKYIRPRGLESLTPEQKMVLDMMKDEMPKDIGVKYDDKTLLRFLRVNNFDIDQAKKQFVEYAFFNRQFQIDKLRITEVLPDFECEKFIVAGNRDKRGRPICIFRGSVHDPEKTNFLNTVKSFIYCLERCIELVGDTEDMTLVVDCDGVSRKNVDERLERMTIDIMRYRYPGRFASCLCTNTPWWFGAFWRLVRPWLSPEMRDGIHVLRGGSDRLLPFIAKDQMLESWGGSFKYDKAKWIRERFLIEKIRPGDSGPQPIATDFLASLSSVPAKEAMAKSVFSGTMVKQGAVVKNWKKRMCILTKSTLFYFEDDTASQPKGAIYLERSITDDVTEETKKKHAFLLVTPLRTYIFVCKDDDEVRTWRTAIDSICEGLASAQCP